MRWLKRYFNYAAFPKPALAVLRKALIGEAVVLAILGWTLWRINEISDLTFRVGGKYIELTAGGSYSPTGGTGVLAAAPSWEVFITTYWADNLGLYPARLELQIAWVSMTLALLAFGAFVIILDWRKGREEHYRPTLYLLTVVNAAIAIWANQQALSSIGAGLALAAELLVLTFFLLKPAAKPTWESRV